MREIKFRAWDKTKKYWVTSQNFESETNLAYDTNYLDVWTNYELSQYTGLKDKNGKEIYEGDIVKHHLDLDPWEVRWSDDRWFLYRGKLEYDNGDYYRYDDIYWTNFEVIGNVYENPELLTN